MNLDLKQVTPDRRISLLLCEIAIAYVLMRNVEDGVSLREMDGGKPAS